MCIENERVSGTFAALPPLMFFKETPRDSWPVKNNTCCTVVIFPTWSVVGHERENEKNKIPAHTIEYRRSKQFEPVFSVPCFSLLMKKGGGNKRADLAVSEDNSIQPRHQQSRRYVTCFDHFDRSISDPGSLIYCTFYWSSIFFRNSRSQRADFRGNNVPTTRSFVNWRLSISRNTSFSAVANTCY